MRHTSEALWILTLALTVGCAAPRGEAKASVALSAAGSPASAVRFHFEDHLSFGARVEAITLLVDGLPAFEGDAASIGQDARVNLRPGLHTLAVLVRASEPCGLFEEPRASVAVRGTLDVVLGDGPASVAVDLVATEATRDPLRSMGLRFEGKDVVLGARAGDAPSPGEGTLPAIDALAEQARSHGFAAEAACYDDKRAELRTLRDVIDDSHAVVGREGTTAGAAEAAQLRARWAEERIRAVAVSARACEARRARAAVLASVERKVERHCPGADVTAER
jgi:hypothetical protein